MNRTSRIALILAVSFFSGVSYGQALRPGYQISHQYVLPRVFPAFSTDVLRDGTLLIADKDTAFEIYNGNIIREYSSPFGKASAVSFGPVQQRCIAFCGPQGNVVSIFDSSGEKIRDIRSPEISCPSQLLISGHGELYVVPQAFRPGDYLIQKYDAQGKRSRSYQVVHSANLQSSRILLAVNGEDEVAVFRPDEGIIHWLSADGTPVLILPFDKLPTAMALTKESLFVSASDRTALGSPARGVVATRLTNPKLYQFDRTGGRKEMNLPPAAQGIKKIDADGYLMRVFQNSVAVFSH